MRTTKRWKLLLAVVVIALLAYPNPFTDVQADPAGTHLTDASNKAVLAEVLTRLHKASDASFSGSHTEAAVDSLLVAYGSHARLTDGNGDPRAATLAEFGDHVWSDWYNGLWRSYQMKRDAVEPSAVMLPNQ